MATDTNAYEVRERVVPGVLAMTRRFVTTLKGIIRDTGEAVGGLHAHVAAAGAAPSGDPFVLAHDAVYDPERMDCEACLPVAALVPDGPFARGREVPGGLCAGTVRKGPYRGMPRAYAAISRYVAENGLETFPPVREVYMNDPAGTDPAELLTEVLFPVRRP
jgi:effector-binding domain-containing protein